MDYIRQLDERIRYVESFLNINSPWKVHVRGNNVDLVKGFITQHFGGTFVDDQNQADVVFTALKPTSGVAGFPPPVKSKINVVFFMQGTSRNIDLEEQMLQVGYNSVIHVKLVDEKGGYRYEDENKNGVWYSVMKYRIEVKAYLDDIPGVTVNDVAIVRQLLASRFAQTAAV